LEQRHLPLVLGGPFNLAVGEAGDEPVARLDLRDAADYDAGPLEDRQAQAAAQDLHGADGFQLTRYRIEAVPSAQQVLGGKAEQAWLEGFQALPLQGPSRSRARLEKVLLQAHERNGTRLLACCLMPNHWHLVLWPREDGELSQYVRWPSVTRTQRWHAHHHSAGTGPLYQSLP
jgi:hypothetical protein